MLVRNILIDKLSRWGVNGLARHCIESYITGRSLCVCVNGMEYKKGPIICESLLRTSIVYFSLSSTRMILCTAQVILFLFCVQMIRIYIILSLHSVSYLMLQIKK